MGLASGFYNVIVRRNSVFATTIFASAFAFSIGFDQATNAFWESHNKGTYAIMAYAGTRRYLSLIAKLWKDLRSKYVEQDSDE
ncbi:ubiquinol-cytochrome C reductase [Rhizoctonia solani]|nr:ubiquinol-cytochrome C reductase [Rhizoctonia solani]